MIPFSHTPILPFPQSESLMRTYFAEREEQQRELRRLVEATMASHHSTREARSQLQTMKRSIGGWVGGGEWMCPNVCVCVCSSASSVS